MDVFKLFVLMKTLLGATVFSYSIEYVRTNGVTWDADVDGFEDGRTEVLAALDGHRRVDEEIGAVERNGVVDGGGGVAAAAAFAAQRPVDVAAHVASHQYGNLKFDRFKIVSTTRLILTVQQKKIKLWTNFTFPAHLKKNFGFLKISLFEVK